jgi:hypothetical protein
MTSWFKNHTKYFIKSSLWNGEVVEAKQALLLRDKAPTYPLHLTLCVIHVAEETFCTEYFKSESFLEDARKIYDDAPVSLAVTEAHYVMMGTKPECFAISLETDGAYAKLVNTFKIDLCLFLCEKFNLHCELITIDEKYIYTVLCNNEGVEVLKMSYTANELTCCHLTIVSSFDLKRCNKPLFKKYEASGDKLAFLATEFGNVNELAMSNIELDQLLVSSS